VTSQSSYAAVFEHSLDGILLTVPDGRTLAANPAACAILGATEEEICRLGRPGVTDPNDPHWEVALEERRRTGSARAVLSMLRADGTAFAAELAMTSFVTSDGEPRGCVIFRDVTERERLRQRLLASHEITQALLANESTVEVLTTIARHARTLVGASHGLLVIPTDKPNGSVEVVATDGPRLSSLVGRRYPLGKEARRAMESGESLVVEDVTGAAQLDEERDLGIGPAMIVPIVSGTRSFGNLVVGAGRGAKPYSADDLAVVETFAAAAGVALALGEARANEERMALFDEQRRIAADMHDRVLQKLVGVGHRLNATAGLADRSIADRLYLSVVELNDAIVGIRDTIFALDVQPPSPEEGHPPSVLSDVSHHD
jgi:PAS domain S-box-containing protein